jgi:hypothetical protein
MTNCARWHTLFTFYPLLFTFCAKYKCYNQRGQPLHRNETSVDQLVPDPPSDRRPLLSAGAGQNKRNLPDEAVVPYCDALSARLGFLAEALHAEQRAGRLSIAAAKASAAFLADLRATLTVMALKHGRQLLDVEPVPLTIDPTESGMPTLKDFWMLREDRENAQAQLEQLPTTTQLVEQATSAIFGGQRPVKQQILWLQRAYMERLAATPLVTDFHQYEPVLIGDEDGNRLYSISWTGIVRSRNLLECCTLQFAERSGWRVGGGVADLQTLIDETAGTGRANLQELLGLFNRAPGIAPRIIERVTIGPYHHEYTDNDALTERAFAAADGAPFLLEATIDRAATTRAAKRSTLDVIFGRQPMESGPSLRYNVLVGPLSIRQLLGHADEDGLPATVYGLTRDGELVY